MAGDLEIRCTCGSLRGVAHAVSRRDGNRVVCYCNDCQAFAHFLGRAGEVLDTHGGTDIFQMSPAHLEFTDGADELCCMRLTPRGIYRWYTDCCHTPIGTTLPTHRVAFVGLTHSCVEGGHGQDSLDLAVGPPRGRVFGQYAKGDTQGVDNLHPRAPLAMMLRVASLLLKWRVRGDHKRSPFFDATTGKPASPPRVLTPAELGKVLNARDHV